MIVLQFDSWGSSLNLKKHVLLVGVGVARFDLGLILMRSHDGDDIQEAMIQSERCSDLAQVCATLEPRAKERRIYERVFSYSSLLACLLASFLPYIDLSSFCRLAFNNDLSDEWITCTLKQRCNTIWLPSKFKRSICADNWLEFLIPNCPIYWSFSKWIFNQTWTRLTHSAMSLY